MAPKSLSFKSIYNKILPRNEPPPEISTPTHVPSPLVYGSPLLSTVSPSVNKRKKLSIDRPLRISHESILSSIDSQLKEFTADNSDGVLGPNSSDQMDNMSTDSSKDPKLSMMSFTERIKYDKNEDYVSNSGVIALNHSNSVDSVNTTTVEGTDSDSFRDSELHSDRTIYPSNIEENHQPENKPVVQRVVETKAHKPVETKAKYERKNSFTDLYKNFHKITEYSQKKENVQVVVNKVDKSPSNEVVTEVKHNLNGTTQPEVTDDEVDCIKILTFTDTHLGFKEDDIYRSNDSMNTFEELLYLAKTLEVDLILHSGDLFDKNVPSRSTMYRTMDLLSTYLLNNKSDLKIDKSFAINTAPVKDYEMQSNDQLYNLRSSSYTNSNEQMMPFFVIHGNHDNPTYKNCLSPIDILDVAGLVTYFGRYLDLNNVVINPILISKSNIKIALYGLGWIKDERLVELFNAGGVKFEKCEDFDNYYKILLIHQNRYPRRGSGVKDYITTDMIPSWFDLVIWGHEHESIKFPENNSSENFQILQLGSTVQTTLVPAELAPKHACLIHITHEDVNFYPISLLTSRNFISDEIDSYDPSEHTADQSNDLYDYLKNVVQKILDRRGDSFITHLNSLSLSNELDPPEATRINRLVDSASSPLVRIKIDGSLYENINPKIFGSSFIGRVANPNDMLKITNKKIKVKEQEEHEYSSMSIKQQVMSSIEDKCRLSLLLESDLNDAVCRFVTGNESHAIMDYVRERVSEMEDYLKDELKNKILEPLSENLYSQLIINTIQDKTAAERHSYVPKSYEFDLNKMLKEGSEVGDEDSTDGRQYHTEDVDNNKKRKRTPRSSKCV